MLQKVALDHLREESLVKVDIKGKKRDEFKRDVRVMRSRVPEDDMDRRDSHGARIRRQALRMPSSDVVKATGRRHEGGRRVIERVALKHAAEIFNTSNGVEDREMVLVTETVEPWYFDDPETISYFMPEGPKLVERIQDVVDEAITPRPKTLDIAPKCVDTSTAYAAWMHRYSKLEEIRLRRTAVDLGASA